MSILINGENVVDTFEIWAVKRKSTDGEEIEIAFPEGDGAARLDQKIYGGKLFVHTCYVTEGREVPEEDTEDLLV
jgi:hypothetical protein